MIKTFLILHILFGSTAVLIMDRVNKNKGITPDRGGQVLLVFHLWWLIFLIVILGTVLKYATSLYRRFT